MCSGDDLYGVEGGLRSVARFLEEATVAECGVVERGAVANAVAEYCRLVGLMLSPRGSGEDWGRLPLENGAVDDDRGGVDEEGRLGCCRTLASSVSASVAARLKGGAGILPGGGVGIQHLGSAHDATVVGGGHDTYPVGGSTCACGAIAGRCGVPSVGSELGGDPGGVAHVETASGNSGPHVGVQVPGYRGCGAGGRVGSGVGGPGASHGVVPCVDGDAGGVSSRVGRYNGVGPLPRGPNYLRNQAARMRKKIQQEERRMAIAEARGRQSAGVVGRFSRTENEQKLHELRVERQIIQEERRLKKLKSPEQMVVDAMQQVALAERCARMANNSRVAAWAAEIASASAESTARSSGSYGKVETVVTSVPEGESGKGSERSASSVKDEPEVVRMPYVKERASGAQRGPAGLPVRSDGIEYNWQTARAWLERYKYLEKYANEPGMNHAKLAGRCHVSLAEVKKYFRLKEEFKIKIRP